MEKGLVKQVETIRKSLLRRMRSDGGPGSGNWGHVGRPGKLGGSEKGGGRGFRMQMAVTKQFTSQSKIRNRTKEARKSAMEKGNTKMAARIEKQMSKINMNIKTADKKKAGKSGYQVVNKIDPHASKNILKDNKRGKKARENNTMKVTGPKETIEYTFPHRTTRGGNGSRGGKTKASKAKN